MFRKMIVCMIRGKLGLALEERFQFVDQLNKDEYYYFTKDMLMKTNTKSNRNRRSNVSLNWILDDKCKIKKGEEDDHK